MRFSTKLILSVIATTLIILLVFGFAVFLYTRDIVKNKIINEHLCLARYQIDNIDRVLHNAYQDIQLCGEDESLGQIFEPEQTLGQNTRKSIIKEMEERAILTGPWDLLMVVNKEGLIVFSPQKQYVGKNVSEYPKTRAAFYPALRGQLYYSDLVLSEQTGRPTVIFSAPIRSGERERIAGVVIGHFAWPAIEEILDEMKPPTHAHLLNRDGLLIATSGIHRTETLSTKFAGHALVKKALSGESWDPGMIATMVEEDVEVLAGYVQEEGFLSYRGNGWGLLIETPSSAVFAPINRMAIYIVILAATIIVILVILFNHIGRILTRPIESLNKTVKLFGAGDLSARVEVKTRDEIGNLAASFNDMAEDLETTTTSVDNLNREITERKKAEEALQESEEKFKLIYETSSDAIMILKPPTWRFTSGNSAIVKLFGVKNEKEFISLRPWEVSPKYQPDGQLSAAKSKKMIETAMKKGKNFFEWTHQTVQGKGFFTTVLLNRIEMKGKAFLQARVTDITERVKAEEQVRQQNEFLNNVLESLTHPFYVIDANDYTIKIANSALYSGKLPEKTTCYTLTHKRDKPCSGSDDPCPLEEIKKTKRPVVIEHVHYDKDGNTRNVEVHAYPILNDEGNVSEIIEYTLDITERKQAEKRLQEAELRLRLALLASNTGTWKWDIISNQDTKDAAFNKMLGLEEKDTTRPVEDFVGFVHPEDRPSVEAEIQRSIKEHIAYKVDFRIIRPNGEIRWLSDGGEPFYDNAGKASFMTGAVVDITERKQAEAKLKHTAEEWMATFDSITDMVSIHDKDFKIVRANKAFASTFKMKPGEIIGKNCYELIHGTKKPPPFCPHRQTLDTGKSNRAEFFDPHLGIHVEASTSPIFDENGQVIASVHIAKDITERKQVENEIRDIAKFPSENPNPVLRVQKDGKILYSNNAAVPLLAKWKTKVGGVVPVKWRRLVDLTFESKKAINDEEEVDGKIFSFVVAPILDGGYANLYGRDITERKKAEAELKAAQEKLIDTAHRAGMAEVAADVLHNVGNVLNSINVSTTVIREKITNSELANLEKVASILNEHTDDLGTFLTEDPQGKHIPVYLTEVSKCLQNKRTDIISRLRALVDNVQHIKDIIGMQQSYAKVSGAEVQTSLSKLVEDAIQINSAGLERHGTRLIREFEELGDVEIDKQKVLQILVNLVSNAKYALGGCDKEEKLLTIRIYKHSEERFRIEVADNGVGISKDNLTKIFSHGFTTKKQGHGFGLHSSALAAKEIGGSLTVHSDGLGQGATFTLGLPFKPMEVMK